MKLCRILCLQRPTRHFAGELVPGSRASANRAPPHGGGTSGGVVSRERRRRRRTQRAIAGANRPKSSRASEQAQKRSDSSKTHVPGVLLAQVDVSDLRYRNQHLTPAFVGEREDSVAADCH